MCLFVVRTHTEMATPFPVLLNDNSHSDGTHRAETISVYTDGPALFSQ